jgi:phosphoribosyl-AMP cyclohydrolase / phosphoribosyl-ATP pyrophosphohydrolase
MSPFHAPIDLASIKKLDFSKSDGLVPAVVQHARSGAVLMLGYMNREALEETLKRGRVVFYSRRRSALWEKGEQSGNTLHLVGIHADCDQDALLISVLPRGPTCHLGTSTCFGNAAFSDAEHLTPLVELEQLIERRISTRPEASYTAQLVASGPRRIAQKVGEEGLEVALAATSSDNREVVNETADLLYHILVLLKSRGLSLEEVVQELAARNKAENKGTSERLNRQTMSAKA